jgi:hypothetical protein
MVSGDADTRSIVTRMDVAGPRDAVWDHLMFYEEIRERPPLYLRLLLPVPLRTEGRKSRVGDEAKCVYASGYLVKRVTRLDHGRCYEFDVAEQALRIGGSMRLQSGSYTLRALPDGRTSVMLETRYASAKRPQWLWRRIEALVCHAFHRYILSVIRDHCAREHVTRFVSVPATR